MKLAIVFVAIASLASCTPAPSETEASPGTIANNESGDCEVGALQECTCPDNSTGEIACLEVGQWSECECPEFTNQTASPSTCLVSNPENTVGLISCTGDSFAGYTLLAPISSKTVYLLDHFGEKVHEWTLSHSPGNAVYLLPNGHLLATGRLPRVENTDFRAGGSGGIIQEVDWDSNVLWQVEFKGDNYLSHHDIELLPSGNILVLAWEKHTEEEAIAAGRNPELLRDGELWSEQILEIKPVGSDDYEVIWEWHAWDHLVQDFDSTKDNFGNVGASPGRLDINFTGNSGNNAGGADWLHGNSVAYNAELDQILLSFHNTSEIYIIDHNTTTAEAASDRGDFLYRWGNPQSYRAGEATDQKLFLQHDAHWIPASSPGAGNILIFNNGNRRPGGNASSVDEITPPLSADGSYTRNAPEAFGPTSFAWTFQANDFYAQNVSGAQRLLSGNTLICDGPHGELFEVTPNGEVVWRYINPVVGSDIVAQGESIPTTNQGGQRNTLFRAHRYDYHYPAFDNKPLEPQGPIENQ